MARIPVTCITGFLGAGKTTLLSHCLRTKPTELRLAVVENEFAMEIGIENELVAGRDAAAAFEEVFEFGNGCLCCSARGEFQRVLHELIHQEKQIDHILVETTGLANPQFANIFFVDPELKSALELRALVTVVDARLLLEELRDPRPAGAPNEALEQIVMADKLVINKVDLVSAEELQAVEARLNELNPTAARVFAVMSEVSLDWLLTGHSTYEERASLSAPPADELAPSEDLSAFGSFGGFPGAGLGAAPMPHDASIVNVSAVRAGEVTLESLQAWLGELLGPDTGILRAKGVFAVHGHSKFFVLQGVRAMWELREGDREPPASEPRECKIVLIGRKLNRKALAEGLNDLS